MRRPERVLVLELLRKVERSATSTKHESKDVGETATVRNPLSPCIELYP